MRIAITLAAMTSLALLAACGGGSGNNAGNAAAPAANGAAPAPVSTPAADPRRVGELQECANDVANELPAGTDVNAFCNCAVDRMAQNGGRERPAMEECAAQMGIQPRR
jgi:hypothetical protein